MIENGVEVFVATFSACEKSVPRKYPRDVLINEFKDASKLLGLNNDHTFLYEYEVRVFSENRQSILQDLIQLRKKISPDLVLIPSLSDIHQDHQTISYEGVRARTRGVQINSHYAEAFQVIRWIIK